MPPPLREERVCNAVICGTGEYVTGLAAGARSTSDKSLGVVALTHFDLRRRGLIGDKIALVGTDGNKMGGLIKSHFEEGIGQTFYGNKKGNPTVCAEDELSLDFEGFPRSEGRNSLAYKECFTSFATSGDVCSVFTPDDTHFDICLAALERGLHVMCTKPMVKTVEQHRILVNKAKEKGVLLQIEVHKRFDPIYNDSVMRAKKLGDFNFFQSYMSQPKHQLNTFKAWAGLGSDISYYLNSHHVDLHCWMMQGKSRCTCVKASGSLGIATQILEREGCEDTITIMADWEKIQSLTPESESKKYFQISFLKIVINDH